MNENESTNAVTYFLLGYLCCVLVEVVVKWALSFLDTEASVIAFPAETSNNVPSPGVAERVEGYITHE